jgi:hypothetical protein
MHIRRLPRISYSICIGRLVDSTEWDRPACQRVGSTHYICDLCLSLSQALGAKLRRWAVIC